ncbi:hypothetical protein DXT91_28595 [Agrobacterium tumefaciens]|uniref:hypothetical protein n=1 Tax=Agrobacterium tumefaciens TaxID=358 RepID=UPI0012BA1EC9|nr:hypothetical protein [Agrobacterium tumefaciens]MQB07999.1 hypothetical protein [Agrobacterium tumefaciens]
MKKAECETAIRHLCHKWRKECGLSDVAADQLSFGSFFSWVQQNYSSYLDFRTTTSVSYDVETWFDDEFKQNWRR